MTSPTPAATTPPQLIVMPPLCARHLDLVARGRSILEFSLVLDRIQNVQMGLMANALDLTPTVQPTAWQATVLQWVVGTKAPLCCHFGDARFAQIHLLATLEIKYHTTGSN
jgi:hypothetical protein